MGLNGADGAGKVTRIALDGGNHYSRRSYSTLDHRIPFYDFFHSIYTYQNRALIYGGVCA